MSRAATLRSGNLACGQVTLDDIRFQARTDKPQNDNELYYTLFTDAARLSCTADFMFRDVRIEVRVGGVIPVTVTLGGTGAFVVDPNEQDDGNNIAIDFEFRQPATGGFTLRIPEDVRVPVDTCVVDLDLGLSLPQLAVSQFQLYGLPNVNLSSLNMGGIIALVIGLLEGTIGGVVCQLLSQLGYYLDEDGNPDYGQPGVLNLLINNATTALDKWALLSDPVLAVEEAAVVANIPAPTLGDALDFSTSTLMGVVSTAINDFLGGVSSSPGYSGQLVVNEAVDLLLSPRTDGGFKLTSDSLAGVVPPLVITTAAVIITIELQELEVKHLNTFTAFEALANDGSNQYTLTHDIALQQVSIGTNIRFELADGVLGASAQRRGRARRKLPL